MKSVANEMTAGERRERLLHSLNASSEEEGMVNFSHLAHAIGMDKAEGMISNLVAMDGLITTPYSRKPNFVSEGLCTINRIEAIEAILRVQEKVAKINIDQRLKKS